MESQNYFSLSRSSHMQKSLPLNYIYIEILFHSEYQEGILIFEKKGQSKIDLHDWNSRLRSYENLAGEFRLCIEIFPYYDLEIHLLKSCQVAYL